MNLHTLGKYWYKSLNGSTVAACATDLSLSASLEATKFIELAAEAFLGWEECFPPLVELVGL